MNKPIIIGIAGGSASGKTSIAKKLFETFEKTNSVSIIRYDDYYKSQDHLTMEERVKTNYDHPFAFDQDLLIEHLKSLLEHKDINKPLYDYKVHTRSKDTELITASDVILLEGLFVLESKEIRDLLDIKIFVKFCWMWDISNLTAFITLCLNEVRDKLFWEYATSCKVVVVSFKSI